MESVDGIVVETNRNNYMGYPHYLLPNVNTTAADGPVTLMSSQDHRLLMNAAHGIISGGSANVIPLLATSADAYVKVDLTSDTLDKADNDITGMVYVGAAASTYGISYISGKLGWGVTVVSWCVILSIGILFALISRRRYTRFINLD